MTQTKEEELQCRINVLEDQIEIYERRFKLIQDILEGRFTLKEWDDADEVID